MQLELLSYNNNAFSPNYQAEILHPKLLRLSATPVYLEVAGAPADYVGKDLGGGTLTIIVKYLNTLPADVHIREAEISRWFNTFNETPLKLLAQDAADSNRQWYAMATPVSIMQENDSAIIQLALEEPYWQVEVESTDTWNVTASGQTKDVNCIGETAIPKLVITPTLPASGYLYQRQVINSNPAGGGELPNVPFLVGTIDTAALVSGGKCQADGDDFVVSVDGVIVPRYFGTGAAAFNQTTTKVWVTLDLKPTIGSGLGNYGGGTINVGDTVTELIFQIGGDTKHPDIKANLEIMPPAGLVAAYSGSEYEIFSYTGKDLVECKLTGVSRAAKNSSKLSHNSSSAFIWVQHDMVLLYGNASASYPTLDESTKPIIDLAGSTNASWVYNDFNEIGKNRAGAWSKHTTLDQYGVTYHYRMDKNAGASPVIASELGLRLAPLLYTGLIRECSFHWQVFHPNGFSSITAAVGESNKEVLTFPNVALQSSADGSSWSNRQTVPSPTVLWEAFSYGPLALSAGDKYVRFVMYGDIPTMTNAVRANSVKSEMSSITLAIALPVTSFLNPETSIYHLNATITNTTTGEAIKLAFPIVVGKPFTVDCEAKSIYTYDGANAIAALELNEERPEWLTFIYGTNTLRYDEDSVSGVTIALSWADKVAA